MSFKYITNMKKILHCRTSLLLVGLLLTFVVGCKKETDNATPAIETVCQLERLTDKVNGSYRRYTYDATGLMTASTYYGKDLPPSTSKLTYTAQGLLDRYTYGTGEYEQYSYVNGALSKIEIFLKDNKGALKPAYRYDVTTNTSKQITEMKSTDLTADAQFYNYSSKFNYDSQGRCTKIATFDDGMPFDVSEFSDFELTAKPEFTAWKGIPIQVAVSFLNYGTSVPLSGYAQHRSFKYQYAYDDNGKFVGLKPYSSSSYAYKLNSRQYVTEWSGSDNATQKVVATNAFQYNNCN